MNYDFDNNVPIYIQVVDWLENQIISSELKAGEKLPSVRDLAKQFQVNPNTIQRAYKEIEQRGLCHTRRGLGSVVTEDSKKVKDLLNQYIHREVSDFMAKMKKVGLGSDEIKAAVDNYLEKGEIND